MEARERRGGTREKNPPVFGMVCVTSKEELFFFFSLSISHGEERHTCKTNANTKRKREEDVCKNEFLGYFAHLQKKGRHERAIV